MAFGALIIGDEILSGRRQDRHLAILIELLAARGLRLAWARYAGDEFVVMLDAVNNRLDAESARGNIEQLLGAPLQSIDPKVKDANTGASVGLAMYPEDGLDVESLVNCADADMYRRKQVNQSGRGDPTNPPG